LKLQTIYKTTATGKVQEWTVEIKGDKYRTISGQTDGKKITHEWTVCQGKNIGRANETSPSKQALLEATAMRRKKLEKDYMETLATADASEFLQPMLAHKYEDYQADLIFPLYVQPKLDGIRCENTLEQLVSRNGKTIVSCPHIHRPTKRVLKEHPYVTAFDGELYNHKLKDDFNEITSLVKKLKPTAEDLAETEAVVQHWVYDVIIADLKFSERFKFLQLLFNDNELDKCGWVLVPTFKCNSQEQLDAYYELFLKEGYEGMIIRVDAPYQHKRSKFLLKRKEFQDAEFPVLDIIEGIGDRTGTAGYVITQTTDGKSFKSNIKGNRAFVRELLENKKNYIGKSMTVKFFRYTPDGIPRFPFAIKFSREDYE